MAEVRFIQPSIRADERSRAFWELCDRLSAPALDPDQLINNYDIDTVQASVLPHLAEQFLVTGYRGWILADTEAKQRALLKNAIALHRKAGTPFAIRLALASVGYPDAVVVENPGLRLDGTWQLNGSQTLSGDNPGTFEVTLSPSESVVSVSTITLVTELINVWKNARSKLLALRVGATDLNGELLFLDGTWPLNGSQELDGEKNLSSPSVNTVNPPTLNGSGTLYAPTVTVASSYDQDTLDYETAITNAGGTLSTTAKDAIDTFVKGLVTDGIKSKVTWLWIPYGGTLDAFRCSLYHPSGIGTQVTLTNFVLADFSNANGADPGTSNTTKSGDTGINVASSLNVDSNHLFFWSNRDLNNTGVDVGADAGSTFWTIQARSSGSAFAIAGAFPDDSNSTAVANSLGMTLFSRRAINDLRLHKNGTMINALSATRSGALPNNNLLLFRRNSGLPSSRVCWAAGAGDGLTDIEVVNYYTRLDTLLSALRV
jgi:phage tail P2-like protein